MSRIATPRSKSESIHGVKVKVKGTTITHRPFGVTCHLTEVTFLPLPQPKLLLDYATPKGCKAELT